MDRETCDSSSFRNRPWAIVPRSVAGTSTRRNPADNTHREAKGTPQSNGMPSFTRYRPGTEKGSGLFVAKHPSGLSGKRVLTPFSASRPLNPGSLLRRRGLNDSYVPRPEGARHRLVRRGRFRAAETVGRVGNGVDVEPAIVTRNLTTRREPKLSHIDCGARFQRAWHVGIVPHSFLRRW